MKTTIALSLLLVAACSSTSTTGPQCSNIVGNWKLSSTRTDGDCDKAKFDGGDENISFRKDADGYGVVVPGLSGACPATLDTKTCKLTANCELSSAGVKTATLSVEWDFDGPTFSGTEVGAFLGTPRCTANYTDRGTKL